jgi:cytochrome P450 family 142 subfamily A polypeptide 1
MELRCMFTRLIERMDNIALASDAPLLRRPANFVSGIEAMPITFTPSTKLGN